MNKFSAAWIVVIFVLLGIAGGLVYAQFTPRTNSAAVTNTVAVQTPSPAATVEPLQPQYAEPQTLSIPKINVVASVEPVGEDNQGRMDVPTHADNVGWYRLGYKPGEKGSAVMDGHLDTVTGAPAVFYSIGQLSEGDQIIVTDKNGKNLTFEVTNIQTYPFDQVPLKAVFGPSEKPMLNLITCVGTWDVGSRNYSSRLVVYTQLKG